jgi:two-component system response regulator RegA
MMDILLVEDDAVFAAMLARSLQRRGQQYAMRPTGRCVAGGNSAPQAIILDLNLGGDSGLRLLPQLLAAAPQARLLVLTGYASIATAVEAVKLGAVNYLAKPASADEILAALGTVAADPERALPAAPMSLKRVSWEHLQRVLREHDDNISATARALNMHRRSVQRMLAKRPVRD